MKRTSTLILLVMLVIVGGLFAVPAAAETVTVDSTEPTLLIKSSPSKSASILADYSFTLGQNTNRYLYYGTIDGEQTALTAGTLTSDDETVMTIARNGDRYTFQALSCGTTTLTYKDGSIEYTADVNVILPEHGWFSAPSYSEDYYITRFTLPRDEKTVLWYLSRDGFTLSEYESISLQWSNGDACTSGYTLDKVKREGTDRYDIQVTFDPETFVINSSTSNLRPVIAQKNRTNISLKYKEVPQLLIKSSQTSSASILANYNFTLGKNQNSYLYYGTTDGEQTALTAGTLTSSDATVMTIGWNDGRYIFRALSCGTTTLTYTDGSITYTADVNVIRPDNGFYSAPDQELLEQNYLSSAISWYDLDDGVIWFLTKAGFTDPLNVTVKFDGVALSQENYSFVSRNGNNSAPYDLKIIVPEREMTDSKSTLQVLQNEKNLGQIKIGGFNEIKNKSLSIGDYVIGFSYLDFSGITQIIDGLTNQSLGGTTTGLNSKYKLCPRCDNLGVSVGTMRTDELGGNYYEIVDSNKVKVTISRVWIEHIAGENDAFSLSQKEHKTEIDPSIPGNDWKLYWKQGHNSYARLCATVSVTLNGQTVTGDISTKCRTILSYVAEYDCAAAEIVTVEDYYDKDGILHWGLNTYLNELATLFEQGTFDQYTILLADVNYEGTVQLPAAFAGAKYHVTLKGGENTRLIGRMDLNGASVHLRNISFIAPERSSHLDNEIIALYNGGGTTADCLFYGYDVAIDITEESLTVNPRESVFINNQIGIRCDVGRRTSGDRINHWSNNTFINNNTAVQVLSLNERFSPYYFRITNSNFVNNGTDFDARCGGTLYLYNNYFGEFTNQKANGNNKLLLSELLGAKTESAVDLIVKRRPAEIAKEKVNKNTKVVTNPRWKFPVKNWWTGTSLETILFGQQSRASRMLLAAEPEYENVLLADWNNATQIVNEDIDTENLLIDNSAFDEDSDGEKKIDIVAGEQETYLGTWIFD